ncbi:MAG: ABC transporter substrate-binding protein [Micromonosporaceae bacterium]
MPSYDRRGFLRLSGTAAVGGALASACSGSSLGGDPEKAAPGAPVKIGLIWPETGVYKKLGDDQRNGWDLFLKLNGGQLGGRDIELVTADEGDGLKPETAKASAERLLKRDKVDVACGIISSGNIVAVQALFTEAKVPFVSTNASPTAVQGKAYGWRTSFVNDHAALAIGPYIAENVDGPVSIIVANYPAGHDYLGGFQKTFKPAGGEYAGDPILATFPIGGKSFQPYLQQIEEQNPTAVYAFFAGADAVKFVKEYKKFGLADKYQLYAPGYLTEGSVLPAQGEAARGILNSLHYAPDLDNAANRLFVSEFEKAYKTSPTCFSLAAYDTGWVLDRAIRAAGARFSPEVLEAELGKVGQIDSPRGPWEFGKNRSPVQKWYLRTVTNDGDVLANVVIDELATLGDEA